MLGGCRIEVFQGSGRSRGGWTSKVTGGKVAATGPHILVVNDQPPRSPFSLHPFSPSQLTFTVSDATPPK